MPQTTPRRPAGRWIAPVLGLALAAGALATYGQVRAAAAGPAPCTAVTLTATPASPAPPGAVSLVAAATCPAPASYAFFTAPAPAAGAAPAWRLRRGWGGPTFSLSTAQWGQGDYWILAWASDGPHTVPQTVAQITYAIQWPAPCSALAAAVAAPGGAAGAGVTLTTTATCPAPARYAYFSRRAGAPRWILRQGWTTDSTHRYATGGWTPGTYQFLAWVTDTPPAVPQVEHSASYTVTAPPGCSGTTLTANIPYGVRGDPVTVAVATHCPAGTTVRYVYWYRRAGSARWTLAHGWTSRRVFIYNTTGWPGGAYALMAWASTVTTRPQSQGQRPFALRVSGSFWVGGIRTYEAQAFGMDCEEASLQMALQQERIFTTQQRILELEGIDTAVPGIGPGLAGNPDRNFVGRPGGLEGPGYEPGAYSPVVARVATDLGARVIAHGQGITPQVLFSFIEDHHPVVAWVTFNFRPYTARTILAHGARVPWAGPHEHAVLVVGIGANAVRIWNPWPNRLWGARYPGETWIPMATFVASYRTYGDMAVVLQ